MKFNLVPFIKKILSIIDITFMYFLLDGDNRWGAWLDGALFGQEENEQTAAGREGKEQYRAAVERPLLVWLKFTFPNVHCSPTLNRSIFIFIPVTIPAPLAYFNSYLWNSPAYIFAIARDPTYEMNDDSEKYEETLRPLRRTVKKAITRSEKKKDNK